MLFISVAACGFPVTTGAADWGEEHRVLMARAEDGDAPAQTQLAILYEHGEGVAQDFVEALRYYCLAAKQGYTLAEYNLGWMYANGRGVTRDDAIAAAWFERAAKRGDPYAARMLRRLGARPGSIEAVCPGSAASSWSPSSSLPQREQIEMWVWELAPQYGLSPELVLAVVRVESLFDPNARSGKNAQGLMQLIPDTAERFGVKNSWDPIQNLKGGMAYLRWLLALFQGDLQLALAGYNAGERAVEAHQGIPPYAETKTYVAKVTQLYGSTRHPYSPGVVEPSSIVAKSKAAQTARTLRASDPERRSARNPV
jgi:hypothetical protein